VRGKKKNAQIWKSNGGGKKARNFHSFGVTSGHREDKKAGESVGGKKSHTEPTRSRKVKKLDERKRQKAEKEKQRPEDATLE